MNGGYYTSDRKWEFVDFVRWVGRKFAFNNFEEWNHFNGIWSCIMKAHNLHHYQFLCFICNPHFHEIDHIVYAINVRNILPSIWFSARSYFKTTSDFSQLGKVQHDLWLGQWFCGEGYVIHSVSFDPSLISLRPSIKSGIEDKHLRVPIYSSTNFELRLLYNHRGGINLWSGLITKSCIDIRFHDSLPSIKLRVGCYFEFTA